jgi:hypothetical protein
MFVYINSIMSLLLYPCASCSEFLEQFELNIFTALYQSPLAEIVINKFTYPFF